MPDTIALLEIGGSHDECLLSQMHAIKQRGHRILLISTLEVIARNPAFQQYVDDFMTVNMSGMKDDQHRQIRKIWRRIKRERAQKLIINTAQGSLIRRLCWKALFNRIEFIGIVHTTRKFKGSFTQKLISWKIKKYFLLSDYLRSTVEVPKGIQLTYFYPIRFLARKRSIQKEGKTICIIGGAEERRKDLDGFLHMAETVEDDVKFIFLGESDSRNPEVKWFLEQVKLRGMEHQIITFDTFVDQGEFDQIVQQADLILPLIHPDTPSADQYFKNQISGAMNVSFGYKIPMLVHEGYEHIKEMNPASFYYSLSNFSKVLPKALSEAQERKECMKKIKHFDADYQEERYLSFIFDDRSVTE